MSPTSPIASLKGVSLVQKNATPDSVQQSNDDVNKIRERLQQKEERLCMLKQLCRRQHSSTAVMQIVKHQDQQRRLVLPRPKKKDSKSPLVRESTTLWWFLVARRPQ